MYSDRYKKTNFELYKKYNYEDVCRLLNWEKNLNGGVIGGYKYDEYTGKQSAGKSHRMGSLIISN